MRQCILIDVHICLEISKEIVVELYVHVFDLTYISIGLQMLN